MSPREAWRELGIDPVDDPRAVRSAYSVRLKAIDVDADPAAFIRLRAAFETATRLAQQAADRAARQAAGEPDDEDEDDDYYEEYWDEDEDEEDDSPRVVTRPGRALSPRSTGSPAPPAETARRSPWETAPDPALAARREIEAELRSKRRPVDAERLRAAASKLLSVDTLARVDRANETEQWLLEAILGGIPRSDALIEPALRVFRWHERPLLSDRVETLLDRWRDIHHRDKTLARNRSWRALQAPFTPPGRIRFWRTASSMRDLIEKLEQERPTLLSDCDQQALQWWQEHLDRPRIRGHDEAAILLVGLVGAFHLIALGGLGGWAGGAVGALAVALVAGLFACWRVALQRRVEADPDHWDAPPLRWHEVLAALVCFALPLAAAAVFAPWWLSVGIGIASGFALIAVGRRYEWMRGNRDAIKRRRFGPVLAVLAWTVLGFRVPVTPYLGTMIPIGAAAVAAYVLHPRVREWLDDRRLLERFGAPLLTLALTLLVAAALTERLGELPLRLGLAGVAVLLLVQHLLIPQRRSGWLVWIAAMAGTIYGFGARGEELVVLAFVIGYLICAITAMRAVIAMVRR